LHYYTKQIKAIAGILPSCVLKCCGQAVFSKKETKWANIAVSLLCCMFICIPVDVMCQQQPQTQKTMLSQYIGSWESADKLTDTVPGLQPAIKMTVVPKMDSNALVVEVFRKTGSGYQLILVELISYDATTGQIVAAGQDMEGRCFIGKGGFTDKKNWIMTDRDHNGKFTQKVVFKFLNSSAVVLKGEVAGVEKWRAKYIKRM
jgi:hypothetical protein